MATKQTTDTEFQADVLDQQTPVLVDFWAPWCGPCKMVAPILEELSEEYADKIQVVKLNTDENPQITGRYGITGIPTMNVYVGGEVVKTLPEADIVQTLIEEANRIAAEMAPDAPLGTAEVVTP